MTLLSETVGSQPGIYLDDISYSDDKFVLAGLRDPLADNIEQIVEQAGLDPGLVDANFRPYRALDPEIVSRRAIANITPPEGVSVSIEEGVLVLEGIAPQDWIESVSVKAQAASLGMPLRIADMQSSEMRDMDILLAELDGSEFQFSDGDNLSEDEVFRVEQFVEKLNGLLENAERVDRAVEVSIRGYTDSTGSREYNAGLSIDRASAIQKLFIDRGAPESVLSIESPSTFDFAVGDSRNAEVFVRLGE